MHQLIAEAAKKAAMAWVTNPGTGQTHPVWGLWQDESLYVIAGEGEQTAPGLVEAAAAGARVTVTMTGDHGGRVVTWPATAARIAPGGEEWAAVAPQLAGKRLNAVGSAEQTVERWAAGCTLSKLVPAGDPLEAGATLPDGNLAAQVAPSAGTTKVNMPFRLHRVRGAKK